MPALRRKNPIASRRRVDDEGEEDGGHDGSLQDDDSMTEGSISDDELDESDLSRVDTLSPVLSKSEPHDQSESPSKHGDGGAKAARAEHVKSQPPVVNGNNDTEMMMNGLKVSEESEAVEEMDYEDVKVQRAGPPVVRSSMVESGAQMDQLQENPVDRRRREHDEYKKKRDADPAFVPNRGAFFMHDHRHAGPAANGFRPFGRGRGGRGARGGYGVAFGPMHQLPQNEPTDAQWTHDKHETVREPERIIQPRQPPFQHNALMGGVPQAARGQPVNRSLSSTKVLGNVQVRVFLPAMKEPLKCPAIAVKQYTRLPDHRPPLRRDKPVRISLPDYPPRYIFPAQDRSFIFIPRAMRPNQQGFGGRSNRGRSALGSIGGYSRRTSVFGGSMYGTSYTPSVAMSRRSSLAYEVQRESIISPTGSSMARPQVVMDGTRPVVRLPPSVHSTTSINGGDVVVTESSSLDQSQPFPPHQGTAFLENTQNSIPIHQPRPQKNVSVADIESPATLSFNPPQQHQQPFHQQVPTQVNGSGYPQESLALPNSRTTSFPTQASTGTPLSQIPERAIHAQPFHPNPYQQQQQHAYYAQPYPMMQPQQSYYYAQQFSRNPSGQASAFQPTAQTQASQQQVDLPAVPANLVAQEVNGMVYYYNAADIPAVAAAPTYTYPQAQFPMQQFSTVGMGGMMTPSPDGFYVPQASQGVVYYQ